MGIKVAFIYDYDGTLAFGNIQEPLLLPTILGNDETIKDFWRQSNYNADYSNGTIAYCEIIIAKAKKKNIKLTKEFLLNCGSKTILYPQVTKWFDRINEFATSIGIEISHFIISSGNKELLMGTPIASHFKQIYGCEYLFVNNEAVKCINYISDSVKSSYISLINEQGYFYHNMVYFGDGLSDVSAMTNVTEKGGYTIGIFEKSLENIKKLENRGVLKFSFNALNCYKKNSKMEKAVIDILKDMSSEQISFFDEE